MNTKKNIALLCDYGLDDAIATLYLFKNADKFGKIDILPISGNFPLSQTFINAKRLVFNADILPQNMRIIDTAVLAQKGDSIPEIHGNDGMGDLLNPEYQEKLPVLEYEKWLEELDSSYIIVSLGPCTVTSDILKKKGALPLVMMAGNINEPPNYNGYEFNHGVDTESFAECVKYPHVSATLDTCHCIKCDLNKITTNEKGLLGSFLQRYRDMSNSRNEKVCAVYDLTAIVYLIHPERFSVSQKTDKDGNQISVLEYISNAPII
ncbi:MAG: nucleoside hydrolase [Clostridia bacterium]|nr:nucleoside hydrolase [Clostridia bacterium]